MRFHRFVAAGILAAGVLGGCRREATPDKPTKDDKATTAASTSKASAGDDEATKAALAKAPPQAAPVIWVLASVKSGDVADFESAYSKRIRDDEEQGHWDKNLRDAQTNLKQLFGDYSLDAFTFTFEGGDDAGKVSVRFPSKDPFTMKVVREAGEWKLDER